MESHEPQNNQGMVYYGSQQPNLPTNMSTTHIFYTGQSKNPQSPGSQDLSKQQYMPNASSIHQSHFSFPSGIGNQNLSSNVAQIYTVGASPQQKSMIYAQPAATYNELPQFSQPQQNIQSYTSSTPHQTSIGIGQSSQPVQRSQFYVQPNMSQQQIPYNPSFQPQQRAQMVEQPRIISQPQQIQQVNSPLTVNQQPMVYNQNSQQRLYQTIPQDHPTQMIYQATGSPGNNATILQPHLQYQNYQQPQQVHQQAPTGVSSFHRTNFQQPSAQFEMQPSNQKFYTTSKPDVPTIDPVYANRQQPNQNSVSYQPIGSNVLSQCKPAVVYTPELQTGRQFVSTPLVKGNGPVNIQPMGGREPIVDKQQFHNVGSNVPTEQHVYSSHQAVDSSFPNQITSHPSSRPLTQTFGKQSFSTTPQAFNTNTPHFRELQPRKHHNMDQKDEGPPQFTTHPTPSIRVNEGDGCAIKALVKPAGDPTLEVEWIRSGVKLEASSRNYASLDRGYAVFQFLYTNTSDTGEYCCIAKTASGQAQSTGCFITVIPDDDVVTDTQLPEESMVQNLADMESQLANNNAPRYEEERKPQPVPTFLRQLLPQLHLSENERAKFETFVQPANDPLLRVEWFKDGKPLMTGCRFSAVMDRGYIVLDILYCYPEDNGQYYCVATNASGSVQSNVVELSCKPVAGIVTKSALSDESILHLRDLDIAGQASSGIGEVRYAETEEVPSPPVFEIHPTKTTAIEGSPVRMLVKASGHPVPRVQWYINGDVLPTFGGGGAWRIYSDGGISYLELNRCGPSGEFEVTVLAKNKMGEATTGTKLIVDPQPDYRPDLKHVAPENVFKKMIALKKVDRSSELTQAFKKPKANVQNLRRLERGGSLTSIEAQEVEGMYSKVQASLRTNRVGMTTPASPISTQATYQPVLKSQPAPPAKSRPPQPQMVQAPPPPQPVQAPPPPQPVQAPPPPQPVQAPPPQPVQAPPPQPVQPPPPPPPPEQPIERHEASVAEEEFTQHQSSTTAEFTIEL